MKLILIPIIVAFSLSTAVQALAVTPKITPTPTIAPTPTAVSDIQRIREAVQEKVKEKLQEITSSNSTIKRAVIGSAVDISATTISIEYQNSFRTISINSDTLYIDAKRNKTSYDKIKNGQGLLCLGYLHQDNTFEAKRIVFTDIKTVDTGDRIVTGKIVDLSQSSPLLVIIPPKNKEQQYQIKFTDKTIVVDRNNKTLDVKSLKNGLDTVAIISPDPKSTKSYIAQKFIIIKPLPSSTPVPTKAK
jgi:hypothetical protein